MSKHKVKRYDGEDESMVESDAMEEANKGESLDTEAGPKAMPRRPVSRTPVAAAAPRKAPVDDRSKRPSLAGTTRTNENYSIEGRGSKAPMPSIRPPRADMERAADAMTGGYGGPSIKSIASAAQNLARTGAKEAPAAVSAARGAMDRAMSAERAAPKTGDLAKVNDALKAFKNKGTKMDKDAWLAGPKGPLGRKPPEGYAKGGSISSASSRGDGIATKGKTRGTMVMCGGGMAKGRK